MSKLRLFVNGREVVEEKPQPELSLAWYLRERLGLTGTKLSCEEGQCGSCTVALGRLRDGKPVWEAVNACILPVGMLHDTAVLTVEGLGSVRSGQRLHPVQERLSKGHGSQCGFCTPGMVMSMFALLRNSPQPSQAAIQTALHGNLCRCTGYRPILESMGTFACGMGEKCCRKGPASEAADAAGGGETGELVNWESCAAYEPSQDPIFPPQLLLAQKEGGKEAVELAGPKVRLVFPRSLGQAFAAMEEHGEEAKVLCSAALMGLMNRYSKDSRQTWISLRDVQEMHGVQLGADGSLEFGAALTLSQVQDAIHDAQAKAPEEATRFLSRLDDSLGRIGSKQLRNWASWAGNLAAGSSISDLALPLMAFGAEVRVEAKGGEGRWLRLDQDAFAGRALKLGKGELVVRGRLCPSGPDVVCRTYKSGSGSGTYGDYGNVVNAALMVRFAPDSDVVQEASLAFGGMGDRPLMAPKTAAFLQGKSFDAKTLEGASQALMAELGLPKDEAGGKVEFRNAVALSFLLKFQTTCGAWLAGNRKGFSLDPRLASAAEPPAFAPMEATQLFQAPKAGQAAADPLGRPLRNAFADRQVTGEARYVADVPAKDAAFLLPVLSRRSHAAYSVDASAALALPGVLGYFDASHIPQGGSNKVDGGAECPGDDERVFAEGTVTSVGQTIGALVAQDIPTARNAVKHLKITYEDKPGAIHTLEEAIEQKAFYRTPIVNEHGDLAKAWAASEHTVEGEITMGGQEHMYMETNSSLVVPEEGDSTTVFTTTQSPALVQKMVAKLLGNQPLSSVNVRTMRLGGAFGGKCTQMPGLLPSAVAAHHLQRPVRCALTRRQDMVGTGKRHPMLFRYKAGFDGQGRLKAVEGEVFLDGGHTEEQSFFVTFLGTSRFGNCYKADAWKITGHACRTNTPSNTAFRAYGTPQGYFATETLIYRIAETLGLPVDVVRERNFVRPGDLTMQQTTVGAEDRALQRCWDEAKSLCRYDQLQEDVAHFNRDNKYRKRGLSLVPCRWGIGMAGIVFETGNVLVHVYTDGSVLVSHAGIEMGQGLNTKVLQVAAKALGVPVERVTVGENATDKVPNAQTTGGSQGSDVHALAAKVACEELRERIAPYMTEKRSWEEAVAKAYEARVNLSATGVGRPDFEPGKEGQIRYYTTGVAATLVEVDTLSGEHQLLSTDIVMDVGDSLNPAVDIGQIEGGFLQGYGLFVTEELAYDAKTGELLTNSAGKYKVPKVEAVPRRFRVSLLKGSPEGRNLHSSRGIGEPPVYLGHSAYSAIREAVGAARAEAGAEPAQPPLLPSPATAERIRLACGNLPNKA